MTTLEQALRRGYGNERQFNCPAHDDRNASASVNVLKGVWVCYACHAHGKIDGVVQFHDLSGFDQEIKHILQKSTPTVYSESWLQMYANNGHPYWLSRFTQKTIDYFNFGFDHDYELPCYPIRTPSGQIHGMVRRSLNPGSKMRYKYPYGLRMTSYLFNADTNRHSTIVLCESATDVAAAHEVGVFAVGTYNAQMSNQQLRLLAAMEPDRVVIAYDLDKAGALGATTAISALSKLGIWTVRAQWDAALGKDIGELKTKVRRDLLQPLAS